MKGIKNLCAKSRNLVLYVLIGGFSSFLDFCMFVLLTRAGINFIQANVCSVIIGIVVSFLLNRSYNFKVWDNPKKRFVVFVSIGLMGMLLSNFILYLGIELFRMKEQIVKLASIILVGIFQFLLNKLLTFRQKQK